MDCSTGLVSATILVLILSVKLCESGITSSYLRNDDLVHDMPLDSDVFRAPPGYNAPQQVWIVQDRCFDYEFGLWVLIYLGDFGVMINDQVSGC